MYLRILVLFPLLLLASCMFDGKRLKGNGHITNQERKLGSFRDVDASGSLKLHLSQGAACTVHIETDENLQPYIEASIRNNTLVIKQKDGYDLDGTKDIAVWVTAPQYSHVAGSGSIAILGENALSSTEAMTLELSGSGSINAQITAPKLSLDISGSGDATLKGSAQEFKAGISGSGSIKAFDLATDRNRLEISGAANVEVTANQTLDVEVSGSGDIQYKGAARLSQHISGGGSVKKVD